MSYNLRLQEITFSVKPLVEFLSSRTDSTVKRTEVKGNEMSPRLSISVKWEKEQQAAAQIQDLCWQKSTVVYVLDDAVSTALCRSYFC